VIVPVREYDVFFRDTVLVNRTYEFRDYGYAVDTGIAPNVVAAFVGRPIRAYDVRPLVLAGTARIPGAFEVRHEWLREGRREEFLRERSLRETSRTITPANRIPPPQALGPGERGRLGENPPRAAHGAAALGEFGREQRNSAANEGMNSAVSKASLAVTNEGSSFGRERGDQFGREQRNQPGREGPQFGREQGKQFGREERRNQPGREQAGREQGNQQFNRQPGTVGRGAAPEEQRQGRGPRGNEFGRAPGREFGNQPQGTERRGNLNE
jgi:hypothetical protein